MRTKIVICLHLFLNYKNIDCGVLSNSLFERLLDIMSASTINVQLTYLKLLFD